MRLSRLCFPRVFCAMLGMGALITGSAMAQVQKFDFQPSAGPLEPGYTMVTPANAYSAAAGYGFTNTPGAAVDASNHAWTIFGRTVPIEDAIPSSVLSDATRDCIRASRSNLIFRTDIAPGTYDVTLWLGDLKTALHQVRAIVNGEIIDVQRMDINTTRGNFWIDPPQPNAPYFGNAVPRTVRVDASAGYIQVEVTTDDNVGNAITWYYEQDEDPKLPPYWTTAILVPKFSGCGIQAMTVHPAAGQPLVWTGTELAIGDAPADPGLVDAVALFNAGDIDGALLAFNGLAGDALRKAKAAGFVWIAGHPAFINEERTLLQEAMGLLQDVLADDPSDYAAEDLLLTATLCDNAEDHRTRYGYAYDGQGAAQNMGMSCSIVEQFTAGHPYYWKGQVLWLRNRGGLDPRRVTASWERAQWLARELDPQWGAVNPFVHLYATDEWTNDGHPWTVVDWGALAGEGPEWARALVSNMNAWIDLFEWWSIHRQSEEGDIGGGWTDDVEFVPAFGLMAFVLSGSSDICNEAVIRFADGIWNSNIIDRDAGYQKQYADVEHTAEPTGNILHLHPLVKLGDPEGIERIIKLAKTFRDLFLSDPSGSPLGHTHFKGNHMSSTQIALNPNHRADIPLCGRATAPLPFLLWWADNPGAEAPLEAWVRSWVEDAQRNDSNKPVGVFPQMVWTPTDGIGDPVNGNWWSNFFGTYGAGQFPSYQYYLYDLAGLFYLRTGDVLFRQPHDAARDYQMAWDAAGRPSLGDNPPAGQEGLWAGSKLGNNATGAIMNLKISTGLSDWDAYLNKFGTGYGKYLLDPTDETTINDLAAPAQYLFDSYPYRTTEGLMTDRIMIGGWANVINYYIGADLFSVFFGMPSFSVTWLNSSRLFAASVTDGTSSTFGATTYLFADAPRQVTAQFWSLETGRDYILNCGPAAGLGLDPTLIDQTVPFTFNHRGEGVEFTMPGRQVYALRVVAASSAPPQGAEPQNEGLPSDLGIGARDISYDEGRGVLTVRVHNIGSATATNFQVALYEGLDTSGTFIGRQTITSLDAPIDLIPKYLDLEFAFAPASLPTQATVWVDAGELISEITEVNNTATAIIGGEAAVIPPPMIIALVPLSVKQGETAQVEGKNFLPGAVALDSESATDDFPVTVSSSTAASIQVSEDAAIGTHLISLQNPDWQTSNLMPLTVTEGDGGSGGGGFNWGSLSGGGEFTQQIAYNAVVEVGEIPAGLSGVEVYLYSQEDIDIQIFDKLTGEMIVGWPDGIASPGYTSGQYGGMTFHYSGWNGDGNSLGNEFIRIANTTTRDLIIKAWGYQPGDAYVKYSWTGGAPGGSGTFTQNIPYNAMIEVGEIPVGYNGVEIYMRSDEDVDLQLFDKQTGEMVVGWPDGMASPSFISGDYNGVTIEYSGWNGDGGGLGHEYIRILDPTNRAFVMKAWGYQPGNATVDYQWSGQNTGGSGAFAQFIPQNATIEVGEIPIGLHGVQVNLNSRQDVDIQLFDALTGEMVVGWPDGMASPSFISGEYSGMTIEYSGWNGDGVNYGVEFIRILDTTTLAFLMKAWGYQQGQAQVTYGWEGAGGTLHPIAGADFTIGEIPVSVDGAEVRLEAGVDLDLRLYDKATGALLVGRSRGRPLINSPGYATADYNGITIEYSGYNGDGLGVGSEYIRLLDVSNRELIMMVYGHLTGGAAPVHYSWACVGQ